MATQQKVCYRRSQIIAILADNQLSAEGIRHHLRHPQPSIRTVFSDLEWLARRFPDQICRSVGGDARRTTWRLNGLPPVLLPTAIDTLTHDEFAALIAARGLLRSPDAKNPGWERPGSNYAGDLSAALHGLLERSGLGDEARAIAPTTISVSRFGIPVTPPGTISTLERALRTGQAVQFRYRNRADHERDLHVWPIRLVLIKGEWFVFAWAPGTATPCVADRPGSSAVQTHAHADVISAPIATGRVKQYALARILPSVTGGDAVTLARTLPRGAPSRPPHDHVDAALATGFHATGGGKRVRVTLAVGPDAWPFIGGRTWGEAQIIDPTPTDLPPNWRRLTFSTTGLEEARHWVLSFGSAVRAEHPLELREWLKNQAETIIAAMASDRTPAAAEHVAEIAATMSKTNQEQSPQPASV